MATNLGDGDVSPGVPKLTSDVVTPTLPTQDGVTLKSRNRWRSLDPVAMGSKLHGVTRSGGLDKRSRRGPLWKTSRVKGQPPLA